ncbi:NAD(P)-dependent oxidoreductase [Gloeocapsopsis dulcis]|uniref:Hydroxyacid dehydrogenase n=1 Tax=Gloeocapsopsis dulcis AAB1 = 1H9 TaxID=1433147 RepID=A0A6N8FVK7_9CHRO|nr:NAD(P)-dependent oxidoreductase [Gloeocapsopsis dulcis]MUL36622.1 hydroxyacid dehydrogenase [Gloeocapsopsis dulcis AAB1 = 1H9]WNN87246.1 NAD(P)-dependent oxidoreductase [Gloeocapsopsis dulcis]
MKVGILGTGLMGLPMAQRLLDTNLDLIAYNRTVEKLTPLKEAGAEIATHPQAVIQAAECIILMLTDATAIRSVLFPDSSQELAGRTVIQMGTISPTDSKEIRDEVIAAKGEYLEAPVLGSIPEATAGKLIVMVGATAEQFQHWLPLLQNFGSEPLHIGEVGTAAAVKLALNQLIASLTTAFAQSLGLIQRQGINIELFMQILRNSALYAPTFEKKLSRMVERNYDNPNFPTKHLLKDINLFIAEAQASGLNVSGIAGVQQIIEVALSQGFSDTDYSALFSVVNPE